MLKKTIVAAATAAALTCGALATAAPAFAASAGYTEVGGYGSGNSYGGGHWNGDHRYGKKFRRSCEPIIRWRMVGYHYHRKWKPIVVGWDCGRRHKWNQYW